MRAMKVSGGLTRGRGITESTLAKWVCALPLCIPLRTASEEFAGSHTESSEQHSKASDHQDLRPAQQARDQADLEQFIQGLEAHPPFSGHYGCELVSLSTGITGDSSVTCHNAKEVGQQLKQQMVGKSFADVKMNRKGKVKTLAAMTSSIVVHEQEVIVSPQQLFDRIIFPDVWVGPKTSFTLWSSLFAPYSKGSPLVVAGITGVYLSRVTWWPTVHSGWWLYLLQTAVWTKPATYDEVCQSYVQYIIRHYKCDAKVIFDGYDQQLSTKSVEHARRASKKVSASILMDGSMPTTTSQADFLGNVKKKGRLIKLLTHHLMNAGIDVQQARSDADSMIISSALNVSDKPTVVVGTDTDLLVALIARAPKDSQMYMLRPSSNNTTVFDIKSLQSAMGECKDSLLFLHAVTGCDTTSALYNQGKRKHINFERTYRSCKRCVYLQYAPSCQKGSYLGWWKVPVTLVWCLGFYLAGCIQVLCIYTCNS